MPGAPTANRPAAVLRRAPFSDNPELGTRGQQARQRILDAALRVFGELGYHRTAIGHITEIAACSRPSFYQYFSSKEDVFRHLADHVGQLLTASAEALEPVTSDGVGWHALREWIGRYDEIYRRYEPVFDVYVAAAATDAVVAAGSAHIGHRNASSVRSKLVRPQLRAKRLDAVLELLLRTTSRLSYVTESLRPSVPSHSIRSDRVLAAFTDVVHRTLFGLDPTCNVQPPGAWPTSRSRLTASLLAELRVVGPPTGLTTAGAETLATLLDTGRRIFVDRGVHGTRVDDIADAAGVSHGAFYRYFDNKEELVRVLAFQAMRDVAASLDAIPDVAATADPGTGRAVRSWLRRYTGSHADEAAMIGVWIESIADDPIGSLESAAALEWGRRRMVRFLEPRGFGDVQAEALVLVALVESMGQAGRSPANIEAAAQVVERGFLGHGR